MASNALSPRPGVFRRFVRWVSLSFLAHPERDPRIPNSLAGGHDVAMPGYPVRNSLAAMARFPWVQACVRARASDMAGLPLIAVEVQPDGSYERLDSHPVLDRLARPSQYQSGYSLRSQLYVDHSLTATAFLWLRDSLLWQRLHPSKAQPVADKYGLMHGVRLDNGPVLGPDELLYIGDISIGDEADAAIGTSRMEALHADLVSIWASRQHTTRQAKRGMPDFLLSAQDADAGLGTPDGLRKLVEGLEQRLRDGLSFLATTEAVKVTPLQLTPRDLEYGELEKRVIDRILATFDVPPVRVGREGANYGTAKQQMRNYWMSLLNGPIRLFDDAFSMLTGSDTIRIIHDLSKVEALQASYTDRLQRVKDWVELGATPDGAARYEGFVDAPVTSEAPKEETSTPFRRRPAEEPDEPQRAVPPSELHRYLQGAAERYGRQHEGRTAAEVAKLAIILADYLPRTRAEDLAVEQVHMLEGAIGYHRAWCQDQGMEPGPLGGLSAFSLRRAETIANTITTIREAA